MTDTTYNGWKNRATWLVALWMNEADWIGQMQHAIFAPIEKSEVKRRVKDWVGLQRYRTLAGLPNGFIQDMEGEDFASIDYNDIAESFTHDVNTIFEE